jgi:hypothetical protein
MPADLGHLTTDGAELLGGDGQNGPQNGFGQTSLGRVVKAAQAQQQRTGAVRFAFSQWAADGAYLDPRWIYKRGTIKTGIDRGN